MKKIIKIENESILVDLPQQIPDDFPFQVQVGDESIQVVWHRSSQTLYIDRGSGPRSLRTRSQSVEAIPGEATVQVLGEYYDSGSLHSATFRAEVEPHVPGCENRKAAAAAKGTIVRSPMTGKVLSVHVEKGQSVETGECLAVVEAMKMENKIFAPSAGLIKSIKVATGDAVSTNQEILALEK